MCDVRVRDKPTLSRIYTLQPHDYAAVLPQICSRYLKGSSLRYVYFTYGGSTNLAGTDDVWCIVYIGSGRNSRTRVRFLSETCFLCLSIPRSLWLLGKAVSLRRSPFDCYWPLMHNYRTYIAAYTYKSPVPLYVSPWCFCKVLHYLTIPTASWTRCGG